VHPIAFDKATDLELTLFRQDGVLSIGQARAFYTPAAIDHRLPPGAGSGYTAECF